MIRPPLPDLIYVAEINRYVDSEHEYLIKEIRNELHDTRFIGRLHGKRVTRNRGCSGPMCKKALRDAMRHQRIRSAREQGIEFCTRSRPYYDQVDHIIDHFMTLSAEDQLSLQAA
jgi:hypothetical protein